MQPIVSRDLKNQNLLRLATFANAKVQKLTVPSNGYYY